MHTSHLPIAVVFLLAAFFIPAANLWAQQSTLTAMQENTSCGDNQTTVCITMNDMANVTAISHQIRWDDTVLSYSSDNVNASTYAELGSAITTVPFGSTTTFNFLWFGSGPVSPSGFMDGDVLYCITFDIIGTIPAGGTLVEQFSENDRPVLPPRNQLVENGNTLNESQYTFNGISVMATSGTGVDTTDPTFTGCPSDIIVAAASGASTASVSWTEPVGNDNCGTPTVTSSDASGDMFSISGSPHTVTYTFTDGSGNDTTCEFTVTVTSGGGGTPIDTSLMFSNANYDCNAGQLEVCVITSDIMDAAAITHVLNWDDTVLNYNTANGGPSIGGLIGFQDNTTSTLNVSYASTTPGGQDFTSGTILYCITFDVVGDLSMGTTLTQYDTGDGRPVGFPGPPNEMQFADGTNSTTYTFDDLTFLPTTANTTDTVAPVITGCPSDITVTAPTGASSAIATWTPPSAIDACSGVTSTSSNNSGDSFSVVGSPHTVTYTFMDVAGNPATCTFIVTVEQAGNSTTGLTITGNTIADCGDSRLEVCITTTDLADVSSISHVITWDNSTLNFNSTTNPTSMGGTIGFQMNTPSTLNASYFSIVPGGQDFTNGDVLYCIVFDIVGDITNGVTITQFEETDRPSGFPGPPNQIISGGVSAPYTFTGISISSSDAEAPVWTNFPMDRDTFLTANCDASVGWIAPTATDDCAVTSTSSTHNPGDIFPLGDTEVIYTAMDGAGNVTMDTFNITVVDTIPPMVQNCPMDTVIEIAVGTTTSTHTWQAPTGMDNCPGVSITSTANPGDMFLIGTTTVTYTITDVSGNEVLCSFVVTVMEELDITCPANVMAFTAPDQCDTIVSGINISINNPSDVQSITWATTGATETSGTGDASGTTFNGGTTTLTYTVTANDGTSQMCSFDVVVVDNQAPEAFCPADRVIQIPSTQTTVDVDGLNGIIPDNCGNDNLMISYSLSGATIASGTGYATGETFNVGTTIVTYTASDGTNSNDCSFEVVVEQVSLILECPADVTTSTVGTDCSAAVSDIGVTATSGTIATILYSSTGATMLEGNGTASTQTFNLGTTTVTYLVTDDLGATATCSFDVVVEDNEMPSLTCSPDMTIQILQTETTAVVNNIDAIVSDNCGIVDTTYTLMGATTGTGNGFATGETFNLGTTTVSYVVSDGTNSSTCSFDVLVEQIILTLECPTDVTVAVADTDCSAAVANIDVNVTTGTVATISYSSTGATMLEGNGTASTQTFNLGTTTVTYLVTDNTGNTATCSFDVTVEDDTNPMLMCRADTTLSVPFGASVMIVNGLEIISVNDNCTTPSDMTLAYVLSGATTGMGTGDASGQSFNVGTTMVVYTLTDASGNAVDCVFNVTLENPSIALECPADVSVMTTVAGVCSEAVDGLFPTISPSVDSASAVLYSATGATVVNSMSTGINDISGTAFNTGITNVLYTVIGMADDTLRCAFDVTVLDTFPPSFNCPADLTILSSNADTSAVVMGIGLQNLSSCDPTTMVSYTLSGATNGAGSGDASGQTFQADTTEVMYIVTDGGTRDSCSFLVIVEAAPVTLMCPENVSTAVTTDTCTAVVMNLEAVVADTGAIATITYVGAGATSFSSDTLGINDASNEVFNVGITTVKYIVTDTLDNIAECSFEVEVTDESELFLICPETTTTFITMADTSAVVTGIGLVDYGYNCFPNDSITVTYIIDGVMGTTDASGMTFDLGATGVTYFVADTLGNVETCSFTVNVVQRSPLTVACPNDVRVSNEVDLCSATVDGLAIEIDDIGLVDTITYMISGAIMDTTVVSDTLIDLSGMEFPVGTTTISYTFSDTLGYSVDCSFDVTVADDQDPDLSCPTDITILALEGDTSAVINNLNLLSFGDNCGTDGIQIAYALSGATIGSDTINASGETFNIGVTTVTYTVTDASGNSDNCSFDVEVIENGELAIACPSDMDLSAATTSCSAVVNDLAVAILSPDSTIQSIVYGLRGATILDSPSTGLNDASGEIFNIGLTTVTYIVTDSLGRVASCSFAVQISDNSGPRLDCPDDLIINIPFTDSTAVVNNIELLLAADNCDPNPMISYELTGATEGAGTGDASGTVFNLGTTVVTYTVTDNLDQSSTCFFDVEVGSFGLMLECPGNMTIQADTAQCGIVLDSINVDVSPLASVVTVAYELSGATTVQSRTDTIVEASGEFFNVGTTIVTYTINDTLECSFNVTVQDQLGPIFVDCPVDRVVDMDDGECFATVRWTIPEVIEGCDFVMVPSVVPGTEVEIQMMAGDTIITYTATDVNGNTSTCSFEIIVEDNQLPNYIFCPEQAEDITIIQADTICGAIVMWNEPQNFDNCGIQSDMQTHRPGDIFPYGLTTVTYTAFDAAGNAGMCSFDVTVVGTITPDLVGCPMDTMITVTEPDSTAVVTWTPPTAAGACDIVITSNFMPGDTFPMGTTEVIYIANDTLGMTMDTCSFNITVEIELLADTDREAPSFADCPSDINVAFDDGDCFASVSWTEPTASDNVGVDSLFASHMPGDTFLVGTTAILYIAIDSTGNRDTCAFNIIVDGPQNSVLICPSNVTVIAPLGVCGSVVDWTPPTIDRPCSDAPVSIVSNFVPNTLFPVGATEVIYIASDTLGYADTCSFTITVLDQELPMFTGCPENVILPVEPGSCEANFDWIAPTVSDNCGIAQTIPTHEAPFSFPIGETIVSYTTTDISGNTNNCQFTVTVVDDSAPAFASCPEPIQVRADGTIISDPSGIITNAGSADCSSVQLSFLTPTASDACGTFEVTQTDGTGLSSGSSFMPGTTTLVFSATDESGNTATCELMIIVEGVGTGSVNITVDNPVVCEGQNVELVGEDLGIPGAEYQWTLPNNGGVFDGATLSIFSTTIDQSGTYTLTVTTPSACTFTNTATVEVQASPTLSASHNSEEVLCTASGADLVFTAATLSEITTWSWVGPNNFSSDLQNPTIMSASASDSGNYTVTATTATGCTSTAMTTVTIREQPEAPSLNISGGNGTSPMDGVTILACSSDTFNLIGQQFTADNVQYIWNVTPNNFGFDPGNTPVAQAVPVEAGTYTFDYSVVIDGCPSDAVSIAVNVEAAPIIGTNIDGATTCVNEGSSVELQASGAGVVSWEWFSPDGTPLATTQNVLLNNLNEDLSGTYRVVGTTANACTEEAMLPVILSNQLEMPIIGDLGTICDGEDLLISLGGVYPTGTEFQWQSDSSALNFASPDTLFNASDLAAGTYTAMITAAGSGCVSDTSTVSFTILARPMIDFSGIQTTYDCIATDTSFQLMDSGIDGAKWFWTGSSGFTSPDQNPTYTITYAQTPMSDTLYLQLTSENGCTSMDSVILNFNQGIAQPTIVGAARYCVGETVSLRLRDMLPDSTTYSWIGPNGFVSDEEMIVIENGGSAQDGQYQVVATLGECVSAPSDSFTVTIVTPPTLEDDTYVVFVGETDTLDITNNDALIDNLTISLGLTSLPFLGTTNLQGGRVTYTAPNTVGSDNFAYEVCYDVCDDPNLILCDEATVNISVQYPPEQCVITTLVTPNNDGNNDNLIVTCVEGDVYPDHELLIFNQWGDEVYRAAPYNNDWSGQYNNGQLPDGTYFYIFIPVPGGEAQKGFITLYR